MCSRVHLSQMQAVQWTITLKMAVRKFLPRCTAFESEIFNESIGIRLQNTMHLGKEFLAAIFSVIVYCQ